MIRNTDTCGAYSIRPYPDGRKGLFLRSIWGYEKFYDPFFDLKKGYAKLYDLLFESKNYHAESITPLFESNNSYAKWHDHFLIKQRPMQYVLTFYLNRKIVMRNGTTFFLIWKMVM